MQLATAACSESFAFLESTTAKAALVQTSQVVVVHQAYYSAVPAAQSHQLNSVQSCWPACCQPSTCLHKHGVGVLPWESLCHGPEVLAVTHWVCYLRNWCAPSPPPSLPPLPSLPSRPPQPPTCLHKDGHGVLPQESLCHGPKVLAVTHWV